MRDSGVEAQPIRKWEQDQQIKREGTHGELLGIKAQSNNVKSHGMVLLVDLTKLERQLF